MIADRLADVYNVLICAVSGLHDSDPTAARNGGYLRLSALRLGDAR
jgi:hypothetical protein